MSVSFELSRAFASRIEIPPPLPRRPVQWQRAGRLLAEILEEPQQTEKVFELLDAVGGRGDEKTFRRFARHPQGLRLLEERPSLRDALTDRPALAALPPGSFGRAYLAFTERNDIDVEGLLDANEAGVGHLNAQLDPHRRWFFERLNLSHDLWHVLSGYETDEAGESALLAFSIAQGLANRALRGLLFLGAVSAPRSDGFAFQRYLGRAWWRGKRAAPLFVVRYEALLSRPLAEVRERLGIQAPAEAHPAGFFRGSRRTHGLQRVPASEVH